MQTATKRRYRNRRPKKEGWIARRDQRPGKAAPAAVVSEAATAAVDDATALRLCLRAERVQLLADLSREDRDRQLGDELYVALQAVDCVLAARRGKVAGMLLELDDEEVLALLEAHDYGGTALATRAAEAVALLQEAHTNPPASLPLPVPADVSSVPAACVSSDGGTNQCDTTGPRYAEATISSPWGQVGDHTLDPGVCPSMERSGGHDQEPLRGGATLTGKGALIMNPGVARCSYHQDVEVDELHHNKNTCKSSYD